MCLSLGRMTDISGIYLPPTLFAVQRNLTLFFFSMESPGSICACIEGDGGGLFVLQEGSRVSLNVLYPCLPL